LGVLALAAAGCGSSSGPAILHGPLAFPVAIVDESPNAMSGQGAPDGGWPGVYLELLSVCYISAGTDFAKLKEVDLQIWNPDGGPIVAGTWPLIDPNGDLSFGSAFLYCAGYPGVGGSVTLTAAGPAYVGSFATTVNGQSLSGSFSTAAPNQCACTPLPGGGMSCPEF
jgi:hypothetical protein